MERIRVDAAEGISAYKLSLVDPLAKEWVAAHPDENLPIEVRQRKQVRGDEMDWINLQLEKAHLPIQIQGPKFPPLAVAENHSKITVGKVTINGDVGTIGEAKNHSEVDMGKSNITLNRDKGFIILPPCP